MGMLRTRQIPHIETNNYILITLCLPMFILTNILLQNVVKRGFMIGFGQIVYLSCYYKIIVFLIFSSNELFYRLYKQEQPR